jgi:hypothetical protein
MINTAKTEVKNSFAPIIYSKQEWQKDAPKETPLFCSRNQDRGPQ